MASRRATRYALRPRQLRSMRPLLNLFAVLLLVGFHGLLLAQDDAVPWTTPVRDIRVEHAGTRVFPVYDLRKERLRQV